MDPSSISAIWDAFVHIVTNTPEGVWPMILAFLCSVLVTQRVKFYLPLDWHPEWRHLLTQGIAFWAAFIPGVLLWHSLSGLVAIACVGMASPTAYAIVIRLVGMRWPWLREYLSQDVRD